MIIRSNARVLELGYTQKLNYSENTKDVNPYEYGCISKTVGPEAFHSSFDDD